MPLQLPSDPKKRIKAMLAVVRGGSARFKVGETTYLLEPARGVYEGEAGEVVDVEREADVEELDEAVRVGTVVGSSTREKGRAARGPR